MVTASSTDTGSGAFCDDFLADDFRLLIYEVRGETGREQLIGTGIFQSTDDIRRPLATAISILAFFKDLKQQG